MLKRYAGDLVRLANQEARCGGLGIFAEQCVDDTDERRFAIGPITMSEKQHVLIDKRRQHVAHHSADVCGQGNAGVKDLIQELDPPRTCGVGIETGFGQLLPAR